MLLEVKKLSIAYQNRIVVHTADLQLSEGEILAIAGESGSGKTTILRALLGCLPTDGEVNGGEILFEGKNLLGNSKRQWQELCGKDISMIFQDSGNMLDPIQTVGQQFIEYILQHTKYMRMEAKELAEAMLLKMRLPHVENIMHSYPFELSGGMRQRVGIAMAMFLKPKLLLADEPTSALDVTTQAQVIHEMVEACKSAGTAMIIVTHNLGVAAYAAEKIIVMKDGCIVESGKTEDILQYPQHAYTKELILSVPQFGGDCYAG